MASPDAEMEYLSPSFDPASLTVPRLRAILVSHDIKYPASAKKPQLIDIFTNELVPKSRKILAARSRTKRTSKGITDMPSSQESTIDGDQDDESESMPPPPVPSTTKRKPRKSTHVAADEVTPEASTASGRATGSGRLSSKHARQSDTETDPDGETHRPTARRSRRSEIIPTIKVEELEDAATRPPMRSSAFSDENPFQSGSSPLTASESRRKSGAMSEDRRKSNSRRRKTEGVSGNERSPVSRNDGVVVPSSRTFEVALPRAKQVKIKDEPDDGLEVGEEFTPEEQLELVRERAANGEADILPPRRRKRPKPSSSIPSSAPWVILATVLSGYALWFRQEKLEIGYCGIGRPQSALSNVQLPEWASVLEPSCERCPSHAFCYESMETRCEQDFVLKPHPLALGGIVPLPPTCEPDGEKARRVAAVASRAVEELRDRNANWECGTLVDEKGKSVPTAEVDTQELKSTVAKKRRRGMSEAEFEDLWKHALGEVMTREEITSSTEGRSLRSTSVARIPIGCSLKRSVRVTLARHRIGLATTLGIVLSALYARSYILSLRTSKARVPLLVGTTLDRLATQAALSARGEASEAWISVGQLRDDVLRDEFSASRREKLWTRVAAVVERNANVRASVREGRGGEVSRVWEWIGSVGLLGDSSGGRRESGRISWGGVTNPEGGASGTPDGNSEMMELRKWDEGRPIY